MLLRKLDTNTRELESVLSNSNGDIKVMFYNKVEGIAPGQSAVFYEGDDVIGGGFIKA